MDDQNRNLLVATALSFLVILVWFTLFPPPESEPQPSQAEQTTSDASDTTPPLTDVAIPDAAATPSSAADVTTDSELAAAPRVTISSPRLTGSISLAGGRIDDLSLLDYRETLESESGIVRFLSPLGEPNAYYALYGWAAGTGVNADDVPGPNTVWQTDESAQLTPQTPLTLRWSNGNGLEFERVFEIDDDFMFTVTQTVRNTGTADANLASYGILSRHGLPEGQTNIWIVHEGAVLFAGDEYTEIDWDDLPGRAESSEDSVTDVHWAGFTDHYWQSVLIAPKEINTEVATFLDARTGIYQMSAKQPTRAVAPGETISVTSQLFAGAKEWEAIQNYQQAGIPKFIDSIDWGWFFMLTKPIFWMLHELNLLIGNMGWAIIALTLIIKAVLLPLAFKSYVSMARMKELQPEMEKIKERAGDNRERLQKEMMELYRKEKVNPAAGCLPILLQIPIFFSLYKVIFVTIELRHAAWLGPFQDLSAPDPTSFINLFGLLPFAGPSPESFLSFIFIGILPILLGVSMWLQQKLNPAPTDPTQQMIFAWMPWVFMFMLGAFASGLVVYWIANNVITFAQQYLIMRSQGYTPDLLGNIKGGFVKTPKDADKK